jgi:hypothetical protein
MTTGKASILVENLVSYASSLSISPAYPHKSGFAAGVLILSLKEGICARRARP